RPRPVAGGLEVTPQYVGGGASLLEGEAEREVQLLEAIRRFVREHRFAYAVVERLDRIAAARAVDLDELRAREPIERGLRCGRRQARRIERELARQLRARDRDRREHPARFRIERGGARPDRIVEPRCRSAPRLMADELGEEQR